MKIIELRDDGTLVVRDGVGIQDVAEAIHDVQAYQYTHPTWRPSDPSVALLTSCAITLPFCELRDRQEPAKPNETTHVQRLYDSTLITLKWWKHNTGGLL